RASRAVTAFAVHDAGPKATALDGLPPDDDGRSREMVPSEDGRGCGVDVAREHGEVLRLRLEPDVTTGAAEPARKHRAIVESGRGHELNPNAHRTAAPTLRDVRQ